jgi:hypothetical protein
MASGWRRISARVFPIQPVQTSEGEKMTFFACMNFGGGTLLLFLGVMLAIGMAVTGLVAVLSSWLFDASVLKMLVLEAVALSLVSGLAYLLDSFLDGLQALSLLGAICCVVLLVANGIYVLVRGKAVVKAEQEFCLLNLNDRPTEF